MNPKNLETSKPDTAGQAEIAPESPEKTTGEVVSSPETGVAAAQPTTSTAVQSTDAIMAKVDESQNDSATAVVPTTKPVVNDVKDDGDLIEKEWVDKAKKIVETNSHDPYKQSEELTVFKADYMKKRYNKNIKVDK